MKTNNINPLILAYLGDAIYELEIRKYLIFQGIQKVKLLQEASEKYVSATAQAYKLKELIDQNFFSEQEIEIIKRARNTKEGSRRKTNVIAHKLSTGLESLFGSLYLENNYQRIEEIISKIVGEIC
ncbi:MAG: ribonuclease III [Mollicutes bacterium]|nr:ribonuclease III [Mollicutes bacterium]